jgi:hypothetical protein
MGYRSTSSRWLAQTGPKSGPICDLSPYREPPTLGYTGEVQRAETPPKKRGRS